MNRSGSISSENSLNSLSTITQHHYRHQIYPSASTSTSSIGSHSTTTTANSYLPRSSSKTVTTTENKSTTTTRLTQPRYRPPTSLSETTTTTTNNIQDVRVLPSRSISQIGLARRATHIPAPSPPSAKKSIIPVSPSRTKSTTTLVHKKSNSSLTRSTSRIGQPNTTRASHIPTPPVRSTTSLGISSIFSSTSPQQQQQQQQQRQQQQQVKIERPKTSMGSLTKSPPSSGGLRRAPSTMIPSASKSTSLKSTSLRMPSSRSMYK
jgi:hypothetical protein